MHKLEKIIFFHTGATIEEGFYQLLTEQLEEVAHTVELNCDIPSEEFRLRCWQNKDAVVFVMFGSPTTIILHNWRDILVNIVNTMNLRGDLCCIVVPMGLSRNALRNISSGDYELFEAFHRVAVADNSTKPQEIVDAIQRFLTILPELRRNRAKRQWSHRMAAIATGVSLLLNHVCIIAEGFIFILTLWTRSNSSEVTETLFHILGIGAALLLGMTISQVPQKHSFQRAVEKRKVNQRGRYLTRIGFHVGFLFMVATQSSLKTYHWISILVGLLLNLLRESISPILSVYNIRMEGLEKKYETFMKYRSIGLGDPMNIYRKGMRTEPSDEARWEHYASKFVNGNRKILPMQPYIFISYTHHCKQDEELAFRLADWLENQENIKVFFDYNQSTFGDPWRAITGEAIVQASHFIFIASTISVGFDTEKGEVIAPTCLREIRQSLEILRINAWPAMCVCLLGDEGSILKTAEHNPTFTYFLKNAHRLDRAIMFKSSPFRRWLNQTRPNSLIEDIAEFIS